MAGSKAPRWRKRLCIGLLVILVPLWAFGIYAEELREREGRDTIGTILSSQWMSRRVAVLIEFPTAKGPYKKEFLIPRDKARSMVPDGSEGQLVGQLPIRYHEDYPDQARLAEDVPLPWWGGVIGMLITVGIIGFVMWLPDSKSGSPRR